MKFVESGGFAGELTLENPADVVVSSLLANPAVSREHSLGICVDYEYGMLTGVEEDRVCGFGADSEDA